MYLLGHQQIWSSTSVTNIDVIEIVHIELVVDVGISRTVLMNLFVCMIEFGFYWQKFRVKVDNFGKKAFWPSNCF